MTSQEFVSKNKGRKIRLTDKYLRSFGSPGLFVGWIGIVEGLSQYPDRIECSSFKTGSPAHCNSLISIAIGDIEFIDEEVDIIHLPKNTHPCSKCKREVCIGMERIECLMR